MKVLQVREWKAAKLIKVLKVKVLVYAEQPRSELYYYTSYLIV